MFCQVTGGAGPKGGVLGLLAIAGRKGDDCHVGVIAAHPPQVVDAIEGFQGQIEVDQRDVARLLGQFLQQGARGGLAVHHMKPWAAFQKGANAQRDDGMVVQDRDPDHGRWPRQQQVLAGF